MIAVCAAVGNQKRGVIKSFQGEGWGQEHLYESTKAVLKDRSLYQVESTYN